MSSPRSIGGSVREGTRVVLKEITAALHNSTPNHLFRQKSSDNDSPVPKAAEHEVKVRFAREFADVGSVTYSVPESLSSASSFHSLSSTLSTKSSSGICSDSAPDTIDEIANTSYVNTDIPGVEELILGCADIHLENEQSFENAPSSSQDLSQDQTFASATDESPFYASDCSLNEDLRPDNVTGEKTRVIEANSQLCEIPHELNQTHTFVSPNSANNTQLVIPVEEHVPQIEKESVSLQKSDNTANNENNFETSNIQNNTVEDSLPTSDVDGNQLNVTTTVLPDNSVPSVITANEEEPVESNRSNEALSLENLNLCHTEVSIPSTADALSARHTESPSLPSLSNISSLLEDTDKTTEKNLPDLESTENPSSIVLSFDDIDKTLSSATTNYPDDETKNLPDLESTENLSSIVLSSDDIDKTLLSTTINYPDDQTEKSEFVKEQNLHKSDDCIVSESNTEEDSTQLSKDTTSITEQKTSGFQENLQTSIDTQELEIENDAVLNETQTLLPKDIATCNETRIIEQRQDPSETIIIEKKEDTVKSTVSDIVKEKEKSIEDLDRTLTLQEIDLDFATALDDDQYAEFKPQRQSTTLSLIKQQPQFEELRSTAEIVTNDLLNSSPEPAEDTDQFVSATTEIFQDPSTFDFLLARSTNSRHTNRLRTESLYIKFDPLVSNTSMLPQGNAQPINEEQNGKNESPVSNVATPKRNPAIAAIDRLLFYSPLPSGPVQKLEEAQEKNEQPVEEPKSDAPLIIDINMTKELELVRATVLQLEEELDKQKKEHEAELERQKTTFQEKINKLQAQMTQEVKTKTQMTVVVEEYEKSISRLLTERERDRTNFEQEKVKLQEELQAANHHLTNTEAAFNDVHQKYERLKGVVSVYKNNEAVLKESIQENVDTIKTLETRYDQLKDHAMAQLEKANLELDGIRKQNEAETVKLHAMIRKAELKSNSLAELVEQKTKENKELAKILDEVIARVGRENQE